jgi:hypothetical protein
MNRSIVLGLVLHLSLIKLLVSFRGYLVKNVFIEI